MRPSASQPFDGDDLVAIRFRGQHQARVDRAAVQQHRAGAAFALAAAFLRAGETELIAQRFEQRVVREHIQRRGLAG